MTLSNEPAFPDVCSDAGVVFSPNETGLTKREYFAAFAMVGLLSSETEDFNYGNGQQKLVKEAVAAADALIEALRE